MWTDWQLRCRWRFLLLHSASRQQYEHPLDSSHLPVQCNVTRHRYPYSSEDQSKGLVCAANRLVLDYYQHRYDSLREVNRQALRQEMDRVVYRTVVVRLEFPRLLYRPGQWSERNVPMDMANPPAKNPSPRRCVDLKSDDVA